MLEGLQTEFENCIFKQNHVGSEDPNKLNEGKTVEIINTVYSVIFRNTSFLDNQGKAIQYKSISICYDEKRLYEPRQKCYFRKLPFQEQGQ